MPIGYVRSAPSGKLVPVLAPEPELIFTDNWNGSNGRPNPTNGTKIFQYDPGVLVDGYNGPASYTTTIPASSCGVGHGLAILPNSGKLLAFSETIDDPVGDNRYESFAYIAPGMVGNLTVPPIVKRLAGDIMGSIVAPGAIGARNVAVFPDGTLMLTRGGGIFARPTFEEFVGVYGVNHTPAWWNSGGNGALIGWDSHVEYGTDRHLVWSLGHNSFYLCDLDQEPGTIIADKIAKGSNIGQSGWDGTFAFDLEGNAYIVRPATSDIAVFTREQRESLTGVPSNPTPSRVIKTNAWNALDINYEFIFGLVFSHTGGAFVTTYSWAPPWPRSKIYYLGPGEMLSDGIQPIEKTAIAPTDSIMVPRCGLGYGLVLR